MPGMQQYPEQKRATHTIYWARKNRGVNLSALEVHEDLEDWREKYQPGRKTASLRLVTDWTKEFKEAAAREVYLDSPYQWHEMGQEWLPWEAGAFALELCRRLLDVPEKTSQEDAPSTSTTPEIPENPCDMLCPACTQGRMVIIETFEPSDPDKQVAQNGQRRTT